MNVQEQLKFNGVKSEEKILPDVIAPLGKMLCRETFKQISRAAWQCKLTKNYLFEEVGTEIHEGSISMYLKKSEKPGKKCTDSCLGKTDKNSMLDFSFLFQEVGSEGTLFVVGSEDSFLEQE